MAITITNGILRNATLEELTTQATVRKLISTLTS